MKARAPWALATLVAIGCSKKDQVAGGYDDVENPAIQVSLQDTLGKPFGAGEMRIYARYQNPGKDSTPVLEQTIAPGTAATVRDSALISAMGRAQSRGTRWPSQDTVEFNLNATASGGEAFLGDFLLVKGPDGLHRFMRRSGGSVLHADSKGVLAAIPVMAPPILNLRGNVGARGLQLALQSLFIPGSPYQAKITGDGSFTLARLARGKYDVKAVSLDGKVYTAADSLLADSASAAVEYAPADWSEADILWIE